MRTRKRNSQSSTPNRANKVPHKLTKNEIANRCFVNICLYFPDFIELFKEMINALPAEQIPLYLGATLPGFVNGYFEKRFKTEKPSNDQKVFMVPVQSEEKSI
jgi:hypothetical protein